MIKLDLNPPVHQLRQFGWIALFGFPLFGLMLGWQVLGPDHIACYILYGLGGLCALLALVAPPALRPIYAAAMILAWPIGQVLSHVILRLVYYLVFAPMGLIMRAFGWDAMNRKLEPSRDSYWEDHKDVRQPRAPASYLRLH